MSTGAAVARLHKQFGMTRSQLADLLESISTRVVVPLALRFAQHGDAPSMTIGSGHLSLFLKAAIFARKRAF
jgi:hypothetical protein